MNYPTCNSNSRPSKAFKLFTALYVLTACGKPAKVDVKVAAATQPSASPSSSPSPSFADPVVNRSSGLPSIDAQSSSRSVATFAGPFHLGDGTLGNHEYFKEADKGRENCFQAMQVLVRGYKFSEESTCNFLKFDSFSLLAL